jgi:hypothetical protein
MMGTTEMQIREIRGESREKRPRDYGMENALAGKVRRQYPTGTIEAVAADYGLTHGEAKGCVYGSASRATMNKVLKRGGWPLVVELMADLLGEPLENYIEKQAERAADERRTWEAEEARLARMEANLRACPPGLRSGSR